MSKSSITILSGGADSTTLAYLLAGEGYTQHFVTFDYEQRHRREITFAALTASRLGGRHSIIHLPLGQLLSGSSLTDLSIEVPHGHYAEESMKKTVVPNRNAIMLTIAWGVGVGEGVDFVAYGAHKGDAAQYPDCRPEFVWALERALILGNWGTSPRALLNPFINLSKTEIVAAGLRRGVPYKDSYSCYEGGVVACGRCGTCCERLESFAANNVEDPIEYKDRDFWKVAVEEFKKHQSDAAKR